MLCSADKKNKIKNKKRLLSLLGHSIVILRQLTDLLSSSRPVFDNGVSF